MSGSSGGAGGIGGCGEGSGKPPGACGARDARVEGLERASVLAEYAESRAGGRAEILPASGAGNHVRVAWGEDHEGPPIMLLGHYDTVWDAGTLEGMPFVVEDGIARGPGVFDMKCGLVQVFWAVRTLMETTGGIERPIVFLCNSDEELGSPSSRDVIRDEAGRAAAVLVLEPSMDGSLKTSRKGVGHFTVRVSGKPSHAGLDPAGGVSAVEELARITLELHSHTDMEAGTTVNVGAVRGGTRYNVIAGEAFGDVDLRIANSAEAERMTEVIESLDPHHPEAGIEVEGGMVWPPMERTPQIAALFEEARRTAAVIGFDLGEAAVGGASDGCLTAALGMPTLDGLGAVGGGAHATNEHVIVDDIPVCAALVAGLLRTLMAPFPVSRCSAETSP